MTQKPPIKKICFLVNYNLYESKRYFTLKFAEALNRKGIETQIIDVNEGPLNVDKIAAIKLGDPDLTCSFNSLLPLSDNTYLCDNLRIPHWSILVDPVLYSMELAHSPFSLISCVDWFDTASIRAQNFENVFSFYHAVEPELIGTEVKDKTFDVVFLGSCYDYESLRASWKQQIPPQICQVMDDAIDKILGDNHTSIAEGLAAAWGASNLPPENVDFISLFYYIDNYTRGKDRMEMIRAIKDVPVHVFGELSTDNAVGILGWSPYLASCPNVTVHPSVPFAEGLEILKRSKISLNSMPFFKRGSHERPLNALATGALPITTDTAYFREKFVDGKNIAFYAPGQWTTVNERVHEYLQNESKRQDVVKHGQEIVKRDYTWDVRVEEALKEVPPILEHIHTRMS
jgi:glycosyltransferase involved in cell wall biosynthesis